MASTTACASSSFCSSTAASGATSTSMASFSLAMAPQVRAASSAAGQAESSLCVRGVTSVTSHPRCASSRAHTQPSPPLFPDPHSTTACAGSGTQAVTSLATAPPARRISSSSGVPPSAMLCSSAITSSTERTRRLARASAMPESVMTRVLLATPLSMRNSSPRQRALHARTIRLAPQVATPTHHSAASSVRPCTALEASVLSSPGVVGRSFAPAMTPKAHAGTSRMANIVA